MHEIMMTAFHDELEKIAVSANWIKKMVGHASRFPESKGIGGLGKRQEAIRMLRARGGFADAMATDAAEATKKQMGRIQSLVTDKMRRMPSPRKRSLGNPGNLKNVLRHADDLDTLQHLRSNVLDRSTARFAFDPPETL